MCTSQKWPQDIRFFPPEFHSGLAFHVANLQQILSTFNCHWSDVLCQCGLPKQEYRSFFKWMFDDTSWYLDGSLPLELSIYVCYCYVLLLFCSRKRLTPASCIQLPTVSVQASGRPFLFGHWPQCLPNLRQLVFLGSLWTFLQEFFLLQQPRWPSHYSRHSQGWRNTPEHRSWDFFGQKKIQAIRYLHVIHDTRPRMEKIGELKIGPSICRLSSIIIHSGRCRNVTCTSGNLLQHLPQSPAAASDSAAPPRGGKKSVGESVHESYVPWS